MRLKGTEEEFGRISITEDYIQNEREEIKKYVTEARKKTEEDPNNIYMVRGTPKNGLRLAKFARN